ncbi:MULTISPECIES: GDP-mannose 4,6-dehydratase [unclassified Microbacterium]|uniref:GDP-mannose 4,6-dehydratase n=1 Tax=unclassified Microbacterium TaxID=2609290 RepID=UPI000EAA2CD9|nr:MULTISPECIES: GDP-mannose 4,6-dehydratase [unclassified Microbacterium]MBT2485379.1 SDR family NAD(P)-dependent oxidoreductase [Microbacterium sp. ISL-108]RKN68182.1 SDR family NAD(P)-dependent oxidoreductase [Microbacterium sp. CGR2]
MKVLLTGADGFIGSHLAEQLVRDGHDVRALVLYNSFDSRGWLDGIDPEVASQIEFLPGDVRDPALMMSAVSDRDAVLHLAALIAIPYSYAAPDLYVQTNIQGTLNLLNAARAAGVSRFIHTSTSEVYGTARYVPMDEGHPLQGQSPYSASKIAADQMVNSYHASFALPAVTIRPFNTFGPRQSARAVIPTIISQLAAGKREVQLGAVTPTRDFTFVPDTVSGFTTALTSTAGVGEVINLGAGFEVSIGQTFDLIAEAMGIDAVAIEDPARLRPANSEVERLFSDNSKAREILGWSPRFTGVDGFREGLRQTAEWFTDPANLARYRTDAYVV